MTEYEIHQLILAARAEFDLGSLSMLFASLGFIAIVKLTQTDWTKSTKHLISISYIVVGLLIFIRTLASIVRFGKLNILLEAGNPAFLVGNPSLQLPTVILRLLFFLLIFVLTLKIIHNAKAPD